MFCSENATVVPTLMPTPTQMRLQRRLQRQRQRRRQRRQRRQTIKRRKKISTKRKQEKKGTRQKLFLSFSYFEKCETSESFFSCLQFCFSQKGNKNDMSDAQRLFKTWGQLRGHPRIRISEGKVPFGPAISIANAQALWLHGNKWAMSYIFAKFLNVYVVFENIYLLDMKRQLI